MSRIWKIIGAAIGAIAGYSIVSAISKKYQKYSAENGPTVIYDEYNGIYKDNPKIKNIEKQFPALVSKAVDQIAKKTGLYPPKNLEVHISFTDKGFGKFGNSSDTFFIPSAASKCPHTAYQTGKGNCFSYSMRFGTKAFLDDYKKRTNFYQLLVHEMTHQFLSWYIPSYDNKPPHIIEGIPIFVSNQQNQILNTQHSESPESPENNSSTNPLLPNNYSQNINRFQKLLNEKGSIKKIVQELVDQESLQNEIENGTPEGISQIK